MQSVLMERRLYANARIGNYNDKLAPTVMVYYLHRCKSANGRLRMLRCIAGKLAKGLAYRRSHLGTWETHIAEALKGVLLQMIAGWRRLRFASPRAFLLSYPAAAACSAAARIPSSASSMSSALMP